MVYNEVEANKCLFLLVMLSWQFNVFRFGEKLKQRKDRSLKTIFPFLFCLMKKIS